MSRRLRFHPEAKAEYRHAAKWYDAQRKGKGGKLIVEVRKQLHFILASPKADAAVQGDIRKAVVERFPYIVLYREEGDEIYVISVFHTSRNPAIWKARA